MDGWTAGRPGSKPAVKPRPSRRQAARGPPALADRLIASPLRAQAPYLTWRTLTTRHFRVNFTPPLEPLARRLAADAERAYDQLSREMHPPRGMIDVTLSDDVDFSNGSASPFPTNRIIVYANPPVDESALRYTNDWTQMVITHELTHIFQLDRVRGIWALSQHIFGRATPTFPNLYAPSWLLEGMAVYEESNLAGAGRVQGSEHRMIARSSTIDGAFPRLGAWSLGQGRYPFGEAAYAYGSLFMDYLAKTRGDTTIRKFVEAESQVSHSIFAQPSGTQRIRRLVLESVGRVPRFDRAHDPRARRPPAPGVATAHARRSLRVRSPLGRRLGDSL